MSFAGRLISGSRAKLLACTSGVGMHEPTTVADVKRLLGHRFDAEIELAPPGMEIGTQHKYAFSILLDFKPTWGTRLG
jgi:hypothetical protein